MNALQRILSSPTKSAKRLKQIGYFVGHLPQHAAYIKVIRVARRKGLVGSDVLTRVKYLGVYLTQSMSVAARRDAITFHYNFLCRQIGDARSARNWAQRTTIWRLHAPEAGCELSIRLEAATLSPMEGECQLCFLFGTRTLCTFTFAFIDGQLVALPAGPVMFVGGVQGGADCRAEIRVAARANGEIAPASMLLIAARAIAEHFGVGSVVGVSGAAHAANPHAGHKISLSYDAMWIDAGALQTETGVFVVVPGTEKPLSEVGRAHRSRTRRKRERKRALQREIAGEIETLFGCPAPQATPACISVARNRHEDQDAEMACDRAGG